FRMKTVVTAHQSDDETEHGGFDEARLDVGMGHEVDRVLDVDRAVEIEARGRDDVAAEDADRIGDGNQYRHGNDCRDQAGYDEIFDGVGGERGQSVNLFGDAHGADLGGNGGSDAAGDHEA